MSIIVTGGAGLIGSAVIWELNNRGIEDIIVVDNLGKSEKWKNLVPLKFEDYFEQDDFINLIYDNCFGDCQGIIHLGACSSTTEKDATYLVKNNFNYSKSLAIFALRNKMKFLYASSCATYGDGSNGYIDDENEIEKLRPLNMYGYSKQMFDLWAKRNNILNQITGCKFSNIYGPNEYHKENMKSVVLRAFEQISETGKMKLFKSNNPNYKDGEFKRDFLYVKDAVKMILHLFDNQFTGIFNIGSNRAETWNNLATCVFNALNKPVNIEYIEMPENLKSKYQYYTKADTSKLIATGYSNEIMSLQDAIKDYVQNYLTKKLTLGM
jgi:ADP-L-glycero-D-manno-heptose 6-epimerase